MDIANLVSIIIIFLIPCMIAIYVIILAMGKVISLFFAPRKKYEQLSEDLKKDYDKLHEDCKKECKKVKTDYERKETLLNTILNEKKQTYPELAKVFSDYEELIANNKAKVLRTKRHPALKAADEVRNFGIRNKQLKQQNKELEYQLSFWENLFPWLSEFKEVSVDDVLSIHHSDNDKSEYDALKNWLSPVEYNSLSNTEKYQLALDRYRRRKNKTAWEIGIEYERYIGYQYEIAGFHVEYRGALDGFQDMGRDLIVSKGTKIYVIQCKYWNSKKVIHEKHIFQLFGTATLLKLQEEFKDIVGIFVTSTKLSETAKRVADALDIIVRENIPMKYDYPCIKCNVNRTTGAKIYHLPFDQQYDKCVIKKELGEFYAFTVKEAEEKGFRRAQRWIGNK